ncbi:MAG: hypothetical protein IT365_29285 [Candidatus Hydrogenedentes bacterium]|nr:hypothetical protein [Candidatus Hydrogenedentota bacterium]
MPTHRHPGIAESDLSRPWIADRLSRFRVSTRTVRSWHALTAVGAAVLVIGLFLAPARTWASVLLASQFLIGLGLGGLFLVAMHYLTGAGWSVVIRRIPEAMAALLPVGLAAVAAVVIFYPSLYAWTTGEHDTLSGFKGLWLNYRYLLLRSAAYAAIWLLFARALIRNSRAQDTDGALNPRHRNVALSAGFTVCFALSYWLASVDWVMALEHHWYSTIFGVYAFTGLFSSSLACTILVAQWLRGMHAMGGIIRDDHLHDLAKLLMGATTLWMYIWFSQYMLIWYANIPEETIYYVHRQSGTWGPLFLMNPILNWIIPFFTLLPRFCKRDGIILARIAMLVLVGRWLDLYLMIYPSAFPDAPAFGLWEVGIALGTAGVIGGLILRALGRAALVPLKDLYLRESLHHHQ